MDGEVGTVIGVVGRVQNLVLDVEGKQMYICAVHMLWEFVCICVCIIHESGVYKTGPDLRDIILGVVSI